jgi:hypothetical protein
MTDYKEKFERYRQEHARLHDPALLRGAVELVPVSWDEVIASRSKKGKVGKKKLWRELTSKTDKSSGETFLPIDFIDAQFGRDQTRGAPSITVQPASVARSLSLFHEYALALEVPAAQKVEMVWLTEQETGLQRVTMDHQHGNRYETQVSLPDGSYLVAFSVDDYMRPDPLQARDIALNRQGLFASMRLTRNQQTFHLTNHGVKDESVSIETDVDWLVINNSTFDLAAGKTARVITEFALTAMQPGLNEALLRLSVRRGEELVPAGAIHIAVQLEAGGAVPDILFEPRAFGEVMQGMGEVQLRVEVTALGRGPLTGMINLPHSGELADFQLHADGEGAARYEHTFHIDTAHMSLPQPNRDDAVLRVRILSDSFLSNYRLRAFEIPYQLVYLKKSVPALSFGTVRADGTKTLRLEVSRSDKQEIELAVKLPPGAEEYLEAYPARADTYVFRFDAAGLTPGSSVSETIELKDIRSGLLGQIKVLGSVAPSPAEQTRAVANYTTS